MFEALTLGVFEVGLSWSIVFGKRDAFRRAFHEFDVARVAAMTERDVDRLQQDPSIIRNRAKIQATVENARAMEWPPRRASPALAGSYETTLPETCAPVHRMTSPPSTPQADAFAKQLKSQGYRFVGPTSVYAVHMQNVGVVNDHIHAAASEPRTTPNRNRPMEEPAVDFWTTERRGRAFGCGRDVSPPREGSASSAALPRRHPRGRKGAASAGQGPARSDAGQGDRPSVRGRSIAAPGSRLRPLQFGPVRLSSSPLGPETRGSDVLDGAETQFGIHRRSVSEGRCGGIGLAR